ncbi:fungal-specific transcription factor domain-containing protein [Phyllosticta citriasiana]|uniref:Fungal-specific transcription factor domain-containing protein n=1 Tax=Phyllosticta citriasiana TaxID=595635 RepID=A0ABR1KPW3_9PEZI
MTAVPDADPSTEKRRVRKRTGTTRERTGCVTCRRRKKKCDGGYPVCDHCRRLNFECVREEPRQTGSSAVPCASSSLIKHSDKTILPTSSSTILTLPAGNWAAPILSLDPVAAWPGTAGDSTPATNRRVLLRYYLQTLSTLLTSTLENNCFASVFFPMATESQLLLNAIIAHSSSHLSMRDKSYEILALQSRCTALNSLSTSLASPNRDTELDLSCCLVLCSMESVIGDTSKWYQHLLGASQIMRSSSTSPFGQDQINAQDLGAAFNTFEGRWLKRNFAYHDVLAAVALNSRPLIPGYYWQGDTGDVVDTYFGLGSKLIYLISEISVLNADMADSTASGTCSSSPTPKSTSPESSASPHSPDEVDQVAEQIADHMDIETLPRDDRDPCPVFKSDFSTRAYLLETELQEWTPPECQDIHLVAMAEAYRNAALIHLYRVLRQHLPDLTPTLDRKIEAPVKAIIENVEKMPIRCLPETTILFPLFMAGGETDNPEYIRAIRQRLQDVLHYRHFHNVEVSLAVLDELWRLRSGAKLGTGQKRVDWLDVLARRKWKLSLT